MYMHMGCTWVAHAVHMHMHMHVHMHMVHMGCACGARACCGMPSASAKTERGAPSSEAASSSRKAWTRYWARSAPEGSTVVAPRTKVGMPLTWVGVG